MLEDLIAPRHNIVFFVFFLASLAAILWARHRWVRQAWVALLLLLMCTPLLANSRWDWPFFAWNLYGYSPPTTRLFHEFRLADDQGRELRFDPRAVSPSIHSPWRRLASATPTMPQPQGREFCHFIFEQAQRHREQIENHAGQWRRRLAFPPHQAGYGWTSDDLAAFGPFQEVRLYGMRVTFSPDGRRVLDRTELQLLRCR